MDSAHGLVVVLRKGLVSDFYVIVLHLVRPTNTDYAITVYDVLLRSYKREISHTLFYIGELANVLHGPR